MIPVRSTMACTQKHPPGWTAKYLGTSISRSATSSLAGSSCSSENSTNYRGVSGTGDGFAHLLLGQTNQAEAAVSIARARFHVLPFRFEGFNTRNHPVRGNPNTNLASATFAAGSLAPIRPATFTRAVVFFIGPKP